MKCQYGESLIMPWRDGGPNYMCICSPGYGSACELKNGRCDTHRCKCGAKDQFERENKKEEGNKHERMIEGKK